MSVACPNCHARNATHEAVEGVEVVFCPCHALNAWRAGIDTTELPEGSGIETLQRFCHGCNPCIAGKTILSSLRAGGIALNRARTWVCWRSLADLEKYVRKEWAFPQWLAIVACETETTNIVWEPPPQGGL